jgi:hypothetical protein
MAAMQAETQRKTIRCCAESNLNPAAVAHLALLDAIVTNPISNSTKQLAACKTLNFVFQIAPGHPFEIRDCVDDVGILTSQAVMPWKTDAFLRHQTASASTLWW